MPEHRRLRRLDTVWIEPAVYFVTVCTEGRCAILANARAHGVLAQEMRTAPARHGFSFGRYVVMPDHLHFFCQGADATLSAFVGMFKQWTAKGLIAAGAARPIRQRGFFDHLLRSSAAYQSKWAYVREKPVRAGLVARAEDWPYAGEVSVIER